MAEKSLKIFLHFIKSYTSTSGAGIGLTAERAIASHCHQIPKLSFMDQA